MFCLQPIFEVAVFMWKCESDCLPLHDKQRWEGGAWHEYLLLIWQGIYDCFGKMCVIYVLGFDLFHGCLTHTLWNNYNWPERMNIFLPTHRVGQTLFVDCNCHVFICFGMIHVCISAHFIYTQPLYPTYVHYRNSRRPHTFGVEVVNRVSYVRWLSLPLFFKTPFNDYKL